jgi:solute:Na+ symporter, SSS family
MTNFSLLDGSIVGLYLVATMVAGVMVRKYVGKVEDFLVAGREMNLYLGIASLAATEFGIVTCMYTAQNGYKYGFAGATPGLLNALAMFLVGTTGFCIKPLRDSGVMTIPELLERRYGGTIRWLSGVVIVLGGLLNMGVFLRVGGEFLVVASGLDPGRLEITMTLLLAAVAVYTIMGGMLSVLITDFLQFVVMSVGLLAVTLLILVDIGWDRLAAAVAEKIGPGGFNPFVNPEMGWEYVLFNLLLTTAAVLTWQTSIARVLAAKDTATGRKVYTGTAFFFVCRFLIPGIWGIAALATLAPQAFAVLSPEMQQDPSLYAMPLFLSQAVPVGLIGLMIAAMLAADMSTDSSYMLTWGSVIYNDIMAPFHRRQWSEKKGLIWNRFIVAAIGLFLLFFGLWYKLEGDLWSYLMLTGTIYLASISTLLIACCYWKRANDWGAGAAILVSAVIPVAFLVMQKLPSTTGLAQRIGPNYSGIAAFALTGLAMVAGSLLKPQRDEKGESR